ncbi:MAG: spermidine/putrescine ABC transporter substrate-binding protein [Candidatus Aminicenantes bacterium]|nr:spermidine/putrescine ABC transporter substrate-binding protein [Candidatus Aminicenantes bacterium]
MKIRTFLRFALGISVVVAGLLAASCGGGSKAPAVLHIYTWSDYVKPELITRFETENNCKVVIDTFDSNEAMYAKLKAGASGYDVITPTSYMVSLMQSQGMLLPLNHDLLPNISHVDPEYLAIALDKTMAYSVPYMLTNTGIAYLKSKVANFEPTWAMFDRSDLKGRMVMLNDMRETIGAALKFLGYSLNSTNPDELSKAKDVVLRWKANLAKFENEQYKTGIASGEFLLVHGYSGDILQVQAENADIAFAMPREGGVISCDDLVIAKSSKEAKLAHAYINFMQDPNVAAENSEFIQYLCPNRDAYPLLNESIRGNAGIFLAPEIKAKCEILADLGEKNALYVKVWDEIKAGK